MSVVAVVEIGLALVVKQDFASLGQAGLDLGAAIITTVTATCILFEVVGPIGPRFALRRSGEAKV